MALKMDDQTVEWRMWKEYQPGKPGPTPGSTKTSHVSFLGLTTFLCKMKEEDFFFFFYKYNSPQLPREIISQASQWISKTTESTEPYTYYIFSYTDIPVIESNINLAQ